jgi:hypothetical protein
VKTVCEALCIYSDYAVSFQGPERFSHGIIVQTHFDSKLNRGHRTALGRPMHALRQVC